MSQEQRVIELENAVMELSALLLQTERRLQNETGGQSFSLVSGDSAWILSATAIVLMMTVPGLAIYYGGMVRVHDVLSTAMQSLSITALITFLWLCMGYSLSFGPARMVLPADKFSPIGNDKQFWALRMDLYSYNQLAPTIPESVYWTYQLTFAIITPALICGSFAGRMKYWPMMLFMGLWHIFVYCPIAHACWHPSGWLTRHGAMDYAGGNVVHISSGISGLVSTIVIGKRKGFGTEKFEPHNILLTFMGASLLWVGWFGFNAGSAVAANALAGIAMMNTQISASVAAITWMLTEVIFRKQPSLLGMVSGVIAGLVAITPACGFVDQTGAFVIGFIAGPWCYFFAQVKNRLGYDDALDAFGVHATGGILGGMLTGCFARKHICGKDGSFYGNKNQFDIQMYAILFSVGWSAAVSFVILKAIDLTMGLRVSEDDEAMGLDNSLHGESIEGVHPKKPKPPPAGLATVTPLVKEGVL